MSRSQRDQGTGVFAEGIQINVGAGGVRNADALGMDTKIEMPVNELTLAASALVASGALEFRQTGRSPLMNAGP